MEEEEWMGGWSRFIVPALSPACLLQTDTPISVLAVGGRSRFDSNGPACVSRLAGHVAKHRGLVPAHDLQSDGQHLNVRADHACFWLLMADVDDGYKAWVEYMRVLHTQVPTSLKQLTARTFLHVVFDVVWRLTPISP
jgi:hypothetical protein